MLGAMSLGVDPVVEIPPDVAFSSLLDLSNSQEKKSKFSPKRKAQKVEVIYIDIYIYIWEKGKRKEGGILPGRVEGNNQTCPKPGF